MRLCTVVTHGSGYLLLLLSGYKSLIVNKPLGNRFWPPPSFSGTLTRTQRAAKPIDEQRISVLSKILTKYSGNHCTHLSYVCTTSRVQPSGFCEAAQRDYTDSGVTALPLCV